MAGYGAMPSTQVADNSTAVWDNFVYDYKYGDVAYRLVSTGDAHGTSVTGCIAAYDTTSRTYGSAFNATLTGIRVDFNMVGWDYDPDTGYYYDPFPDAVKYDNEHIQLKNNSYGTSKGYLGSDSDTLGSYENAKAHNTGLLFSAGNERTRGGYYTNCADSNKKVSCAHPYTITVAATGTTSGEDYDYSKYAYFSCFGACVFVCAPGEGIQTSDRVDTQTKYYYDLNQGYYTINDDRTKNIYQGYSRGSTTDEFNGTSAASPIATGVVALGIQAYQDTFCQTSCDVRYLKHMLARTSSKISLKATDANEKWQTNAAGLSFSHSYGFGQVNAGELVSAISDSKTYFSDGKLRSCVTPQTIATTQWVTKGTEGTKTITSSEKLLYDTDKYDMVTSTSYKTKANMEIKPVLEQAEITVMSFETLPEETLVKTFTASFDDFDFSNVNITKQCLEEVVLTVDMSATGDYFDSRYLQITLEHGGTLSYMAFAQIDSIDDTAYFEDMQWSFSSNAFWGEDPTGDWTINIYNGDSANGFKINNLWTTFYMGELSNCIDASSEKDNAWDIDGTMYEGVRVASEDVTHSQSLNMSVDSTFEVSAGKKLEQTGKITATNTPDIIVEGEGTLKLNPTSAIDGKLGTVNVGEDATLELAGNNSNLSVASETIVDGTLEFSEYTGTTDMQLNNLSGSGTISGTNKNLTLDSNVNNPGIFDGTINVGTGTITKTGTGTLKLYSQADDYSNLSAESIIVNAGRLDLKGYYQGNIKVEAGAKLSPGNSTGQLTVKDGNVTLDKGSQLILEIGGQGFEDNDRLDISGSLILGEDVSILLTPSEDSTLATNETFQTYIKANNVTTDWSKFFQVVAFADLQYNVSDGKLWIFGTYLGASGVPEPSTWALLILGFAGLMKVTNCKLRVARKSSK